jgi:hypothetical protein
MASESQCKKVADGYALVSMALDRSRSSGKMTHHISSIEACLL